ncbi:hypothetical protein S83_019980, partial [Arachis hypogaea]
NLASHRSSARSLVTPLAGRQCLLAFSFSVCVVPAALFPPCLACLCLCFHLVPRLPLLPPSSLCWFLCRLCSTPLRSSVISRRWPALQRPQVGKPSLTLFLTFCFCCVV